MPRATCNGIELEYDSTGDPDAPTMLLIMGFGVQMIHWSDDFVRLIADRGFHVVRFDNRDVGLSTRMTAEYALDDMADDAVGLLDHLGIDRAHVVGASMGGMIAQLVAIRHPQRVQSLTSIMSTTGNPEVGQATPEAMQALLSPPPATREEAIARGVAVQAVIGSRTHPMAEADVVERTARAWDRDPVHDYSGNARQLMAIMGAPDRTAALAALDVPTLVIHGAQDPLVTPSGGDATATAVPGAEHLVVDDMGHDLPRPVWPTIVDAIVRNAERARSAA